MEDLPLVHCATKCATTGTGDWRNFKPILDKKTCTKCGLCATYCPDGIIIMIKGDYEPDYTFCKGCGICANVCPIKAIRMVQEP
jgi:2-oxoacid:acceptor oxidoreductase delta subunit (pyruvate/2-ketoisovalerate family)